MRKSGRRRDLGDFGLSIDPTSDTCHLGIHRWHRDTFNDSGGGRGEDAVRNREGSGDIA